MVKTQVFEISIFHRTEARCLMTRNEKEQTIISQIENYYYQEWKNETLEMNLKNETEKKKNYVQDKLKSSLF